MRLFRFQYARHQKTLKMPAILALGMAIWWGVLPVLSPLHLAFSTHPHLYCKDHQRYEDLAPKTDSHAAHLSEPSSDSESKILFGMSTAVADSHIDCPLSNLLLHYFAISSDDASSVVLFDTASGRDKYLSLATPVTSILAIAPKHSPPLLVS